jgi:hypothetical protein
LFLLAWHFCAAVGAASADPAHSAVPHSATIIAVLNM